MQNGDLFRKLEHERQAPQAELLGGAPTIDRADLDIGRSRAGAVMLAVTLFGGIGTAVGTAVFRLAGGSFGEAA